MHMKRIFTLMWVVLCLAAMPTTAQTIWDGTTDTEWLGTGTQADPYQISSPQELAGLAELVNNKTKDFAGEYVCLTADIYLNAESTPDSLKLEWPRIGGISREQNGENFAFDSTAFRGHFDGRNHTIHGIHYGQMPADSTGWDDPFVDFVVDFTGWERGLFGLLTNATIENLKLHKMTLAGASQMGGLSPYANYTTIRNVHITESSVRSSLGEYGGGAGGMIGNLVGCLVENCTVDAHVQGTRGVGVLASSADSTTVIRNCSTSGFAYMSQYTCGGLVGYNLGLIERCSASANVSRGYYTYAQSSGAPDCAGFVGDNSGMIRDCYATGNVVQAQLEGHGFCGRNTGRLENCYATGNVEGYVSCNVSTFLGVNGIAGTYGAPDIHGTVINCFGTGTCTFINPDNEYVVYGGVIGRSWCAGVSHITNCYFDSDKNPLVQTKVYGDFDVTTAYLQSKEFVDTLNMMSALLGLTIWQYNPGSYPTLTTEKATNITDYFAGGSGTAADPWRIETKEHLQNLAKYVNLGYHFAGDTLLQTADIVLNPPFEKWGEEMPELWTPIGKTVIGHNVAQQELSYTYFFNGMYDGGLHEIQNLYCYSLTDKQGLFGKLYHNARIRNLGVTGAYVIGTGNSGILAAEVDRYAVNVDIRQCWTSGYVEDKSWGAAGILGQIATAGSVCNTNILNCYTSATIKGAIYTKPVVGDQNYSGGETDTVGNFLFYGTASEVYHASGGTENNRNYFFNLDSVAGATNSVSNYEAGGRSTAYLQSKDFVNELNAWVSTWNETHTADPLYYWQYRENNYPFYTTTVPEHYTVTFVMNGGSAITSQYILPGSKIAVPATPTKEDEIFAGWFTDATFTQGFDPEQPINADLTLYAKWLPADYAEDYSFINPFATSFVIKNKEQLAALRNIVNGVSAKYARDVLDGKTIKLGNDIVLNDTTNWQQWGKTAAATPWWPIGAHNYATFDCTFDGQGHKIIGLYSVNNTACGIALHSDGYIGLFGYVGEKASIQNVGIEAAYCEGDVYVGALAGYSQAPITNCYARARVANTPETENRYRGYSGILIGETTASVTDCYAMGEIIGMDNIGGLIGNVNYLITDTIRHCYTYANVEGRYSVGGLIGTTKNCVVEECYAICNVVLSAKHIAPDCPCNNVGGLIGTSGTINNCYGMGSIRSEGGLTGCIAGWLGATIRNSYYVGSVQGIWYDGLASGESRTKENSYYNSDYPIQGEITTQDTIYGRTTGELKTYETYMDWNFNTIWGMRSTYNDGYPYLQHFLPEELRGQVEAIYLDTRKLPMVQNTTETLYVTFRPASATCDLIWESEDPAVVEVNNGILTAKSVGTSLIRVHDAVGTVSDSCMVTVVATAEDIPSITIHFKDETWGSWSKIYLYAWSTDGRQTEYLGAWPGIEMSPMEENWYSYTFSSRISDVNFILHAGDGFAQSSDLWTDQDVCYVGSGWEVALVDCDTSLPSDVDYVTLNESVVTLGVGETKQLIATVFPEDAPNKNVTWESSYPTFVSVDNMGNITGHNPGIATITVTTEEGKKTASCKVMVNRLVTDVTLSETTLALNVGDIYALIATVLPENATNKAVTWSSSAIDIVSVNNGTLTAHAAGEAIITVTTEDGGKQATCKVTVTDPSRVSSITLDTHEVTLEEGQTYQLNATVFPETATNKNISWHSQNINFVHISNGLITAQAAGSTYVYVRTYDGSYTDTCWVTVVKPTVIPVTGITLSQTSLEMEIGETYTLIATITPADATNHTVNWLSINPSVVSVQNGVLEALAIGNATIIATTVDGGKTAMCNVTVVDNTLTAIENMDANNANRVRKVLENGTIYIIRNGEKHTIDGRKVE